MVEINSNESKYRDLKLIPFEDTHHEKYKYLDKISVLSEINLRLGQDSKMGIYNNRYYDIVKFKLYVVDLRNPSCKSDRVFDFNKNKYVNDIVFFGVSCGLHLHQDVFRNYERISSAFNDEEKKVFKLLKEIYDLKPKYYDGTKRQLQYLSENYQGKYIPDYEQPYQILSKGNLLSDEEFEYGRSFTFDYSTDNVKKQIDLYAELVEFLKGSKVHYYLDKGNIDEHLRVPV